ncbi:non-canonical purine NTP pyrophosphatase [uncultured Bifidobacterium sp.]|uniref:non-canonical purine NTP pyrophosphatase n=1 Tax=uncultured Bifidobacterium sp. TaxID=165187 RepID=UPI0026239C8C|nr:non-canonical purine NTP pyrophosphatase [uncultured Bifidobacterium sp.]
MRIVVATHNEGKLVEIRRILRDNLPVGEGGVDGIELVSAGSLGLPDPVETGVTFQENALMKARDVASRTGSPAIADDSGLIVDILGNAPGILSARWSGVHGDDEANNRLLLAQLADIPANARGARFRCAAALVVPDSMGGVPSADDAVLSPTDLDTSFVPVPCQIVTVGDMTGHILTNPRGSNGFGYDPLFVPDEQRVEEGHAALTSAEMSSDRKNSISHRGKAFVAMCPVVQALLRA